MKINVSQYSMLISLNGRIKQNERYRLKRDKKLLALAEDLESTLTVIAYAGKENDLDFIRQRQLALKKEYGEKIFCGEPNTLVSPCDTPAEIKKKYPRYNLMLLAPGLTRTEDTFVMFMQMLSEKHSPEYIREESENMLMDLISATGGIIIPQD